MTASPADTAEARGAVETAIYSCNHADAKNNQVILQPWRSETSSVPPLGDHPQSLINAQGMDELDLVFAQFGGRLGSPTPIAVSALSRKLSVPFSRESPCISTSRRVQQRLPART